MKTYNEMFLEARKRLKNAGIEAYSLEARLIMIAATGKTREEYARDMQLYAPDELEEKLDGMLARRTAGEPVAYITGEWEFYGITLNMTPDVLVPRIDTEVLAEKAIEELNSRESGARVLDLCCGSGCVGMQMVLKEGLFNQVLAEQCGTEIRSDAHLLALLRELVAAKKEYDHVAQALQSVRETGYGLVPPQLDELTLQEPEIMGKGGKFGVRLRASAPSLHLIRVDIQTEVSPVVGTEQQSEEMLRYLMEGFEQNPQKLWQSNLFGKPLSDLVREGLSNKLMHMPEDTQLKVQQTLEKIINEGNGGMVCILL